MYFLTYEEWNAILLVAIGPKKRQTEIITQIKMDLNDHRMYVKKVLIEKGYFTSEPDLSKEKFDQP